MSMVNSKSQRLLAQFAVSAQVTLSTLCLRTSGNWSEQAVRFGRVRPVQWPTACWRLRGILLERSELADGGDGYVLTSNRPLVLKSGAGWANAKMRTCLGKIIRKAGLTSWPRLWHKVRASRQMELANHFPSHVVCQWIGNSEDVAREHYPSVTRKYVEQAIVRKALPAVIPQMMPSAGDLPRMKPHGQNRQSGSSVRNLNQRKEKRSHARTCDRLKVVGGGFEPPTCGL